MSQNYLKSYTFGTDTASSEIPYPRLRVFSDNNTERDEDNRQNSCQLEDCPADQDQDDDSEDEEFYRR